MADYYKLTLAKKELVAKDIMRFYFLPNERFFFRPGNYALMSNNKNDKVAGLIRPFTINSNTFDEYLVFTIKKVGTFTTELHNLDVGDSVDIEAPFGVMAYDEELHNGKKLIYVAGGTGITPFLSIRHYVEEKGLDAEFKVIYSVKTADEIIDEEVLKKYDSIIILSQEEKEGYYHGRIDEEFLKEHLTDEELKNAYFFVCGPPKMEDAVFSMLERIGAKNITLER